MTEHFSPKSQRSLPLTLHKALSKVKGKSLRSFCLVTCLQRWCFQQRTRGHEHPSVHLPRPPRTPSMQLHPRGGPSAAAPSQPGVPGSPGTRPPPSAGRRGLVGLLELGLSLCTLRVWGPFGSQGRVGVLCRTGLGSRDASPLGTYLFLTPPPPFPKPEGASGKAGPCLVAGGIPALLSLVSVQNRFPDHRSPREAAAREGQPRRPFRPFM